MMVDADQTASSVISNTSASSVNTLQPISVFKTVKITKSEAGGFGFNIIGGTDGPYIPGHTGIFFSRIRNADLESKISEGDRIISVNDKSMEEITHEEAVEILKQLEGECEFKIQTNAERAIAMAMSFDTTPEGSTDMESMSTRPSHASTRTASLHLMPNLNNAHGYPSQLTEIAIVVVGAAALSLIAYVGYNRIRKGTWWK